MQIFRNILIFNITIGLFSWYFWGLRYNLDTSPIVYATVIFVLNSVLAWWVFPRHQNSAYFLLGTSSLILVLNLILLHGLITLR